MKLKDVEIVVINDDEYGEHSSAYSRILGRS
jgi:hypothetical protein